MSVRLIEFRPSCVCDFSASSEMGAACHVETSPEKGLVDTVVHDGEVLVPASVGTELRHEEVARPIRFEADIGHELESRIRTGIGFRIENVVGEDRADLGLAEQQEAPKLHADGDIGIKVVTRRRKSSMAREVSRPRQLKTGLAQLCRNAEFRHGWGRRLLLPHLVDGRRCRRPGILIADAAKGGGTLFSVRVGPGLRANLRLSLASACGGGRGA